MCKKREIRVVLEEMYTIRYFSHGIAIDMTRKTNLTPGSSFTYECVGVVRELFVGTQPHPLPSDPVLLSVVNQGHGGRGCRMSFLPVRVRHWPRIALWPIVPHKCPVDHSPTRTPNCTEKKKIIL